MSDETIGRTTTLIPGSTTDDPAEWAREMSYRFDSGGNRAMAETMADVARRIDEARETGMGRYYEVVRERDDYASRCKNLGRALAEVYRGVINPYATPPFPLPSEFLNEEMTEEEVADLVGQFSGALTSAARNLRAALVSSEPRTIPEDEPRSGPGEDEGIPAEVDDEVARVQAARLGEDPPEPPTFDEAPVSDHGSPSVHRAYQFAALEQLEKLYVQRSTRKQIEIGDRRIEKYFEAGGKGPDSNFSVFVEKGWLSRALVQMEALGRAHPDKLGFSFRFLGERVDVVDLSTGSAVTVGYVDEAPSPGVDWRSAPFDATHVRSLLKGRSSKEPVLVDAGGESAFFADGTLGEMEC